MNVPIRLDLSFPAAVYLPESQDIKLMFSHYDIMLDMLVVADDQTEINIALSRARTFIETILSDAVFIDSAHHQQVSQLRELGVKAIDLPAPPVDQIVGMTLFCKLSAIMQDKIQLDRVDIRSSLGDHVWYPHCAGDPLEMVGEKGWWHEGDTSHCSFSLQEKHDNVSRIKKDTWSEYGLGWPKKKAKNNSIVYAKFGYDNNK